MGESGHHFTPPSNGKNPPDLQESREFEVQHSLDLFLKELEDKNVLSHLKAIVNREIKQNRDPAIELGIPYGSISKNSGQIKILFDPEPVTRIEDGKEVKVKNVNSPHGSRDQLRSKSLKISFGSQGQPQVSYFAEVADNQSQPNGQVESLAHQRKHEFNQINDGDFEKTVKVLPPKSKEWIAVDLAGAEYKQFRKEKEKKNKQEEAKNKRDPIESEKRSAFLELEYLIPYAMERTVPQFDWRTKGDDGKFEGSSERRMLTQRVH